MPPGVPPPSKTCPEQDEEKCATLGVSSNGKTSTKDLTASVLSQGLRTIATQGNLNNHIGVPLSILRAAPSDEAAVWEMGMNHSGELAPLCEMTRQFPKRPVHRRL